MCLRSLQQHADAVILYRNDVIAAEAARQSRPGSGARRSVTRRGEKDVWECLSYLFALSLSLSLSVRFAIEILWKCVCVCVCVCVCGLCWFVANVYKQHSACSPRFLHEQLVAYACGTRGFPEHK